MNFLVPGLSAMSLLLLSASALAQTPPATNPGDASTNPGDTEVPVTPYEYDERGGHLQFGLSAAYLMPFGKASTDYLARELGGAGPAFGADATYGLDRFVALGAYGRLALLGDSGECNSCKALSWTAGILVRYHFAQGLRLDPWISYGVGYRQLSGVKNVAFTDPTETASNYRGIEWLKLQVGADWYASSVLAFAPFGEFNAATLIKRPGSDSDPSVDLHFQFGLRIAFDFPGR